jgi:hypothetical protein
VLAHEPGDRRGQQPTRGRRSHLKWQRASATGRAAGPIPDLRQRSHHADDIGSADAAMRPSRS